MIISCLGSDGILIHTKKTITETITEMLVVGNKTQTFQDFVQINCLDSQIYSEFTKSPTKALNYPDACTERN